MILVSTHNMSWTRNKKIISITPSYLGALGGHYGLLFGKGIPVYLL